MKRALKILVILILAVTFGYLLGVGSTNQTVRVYDSSGQLIATQTSPATGQLLTSEPDNVILPGLKMESVPWYISRSTAIAAYLLLFAIVMWGLGMAINLTYNFIDPARAWQIHKDMSLAFCVLVAVHASSLLFDKFIGFNLLDILVPYLSTYKSFYLSLGIIGFYLLLAIISISIFMRLSRPRLWRYSHYLVYPLFVFATVHGFFIGTDSKSLIMQWVYGLAGSSFILFFICRFIIYPWQRRRM